MGQLSKFLLVILFAIYIVMCVLIMVTFSSKGLNISIEETAQYELPQGCEINISTHVEIFQEALLQEISFLSIDFTIENMSDIYANESNVVNPKRWVWALEGKGLLLLRFSPGFEAMSFGTLSPGVEQINIDLDLPKSGCFKRAKDTERQLLLAQFVNNLARISNESLSSKREVYDKKGFWVCSEKYEILGGDTNCILTHLRAPSVSNWYHCWRGGMSLNGTWTPTKFDKNDWISSVSIIFGFVFTFFGHLMLVLFVRKNPPVLIGGEKCIAPNSDTPIGFKYGLLYSECCGYKTPILIVRTTFAAFCIAIIPLIPYFLEIHIANDAFRQNRGTFFPSTFTIVCQCALVILSELSIIIVLIIFMKSISYVRGHSDALKVLKGRIQQVDYRYFSIQKEIIVDIHNNNNNNNNNNKILNILAESHRYVMLSSVSFARRVCSPRSCKSACKGLRYLCRRDCCIKLLLVVMLLPLLLVKLHGPLWAIHYYLYKGTNETNAFYSIIIFSIYIGSFLTFCAYFHAARCAVESVIYTFIGIVINLNAIARYLVTMVTIVSVIIHETTQLYDKYHRLVTQIVAEAEKIDSKVEQEQANNKFIRHASDGTPYITLKLFHDVVRDFYPLSRRV